MPKNAYLEKQAMMVEAYLTEGVRIGYQRAFDEITIALNDPDALGSRALGWESIQKVFSKAHEVDEYYADAFFAKSESDYYREKLDQKLNQISGGKVPPFETRYPWIKKLKYTKGR